MTDGLKKIAALPGFMPSFRRQLLWFLVLRAGVITLLLGGTIVYQLRGGTSEHPALPYLYLLIGLYYLQALISGFFLPKVQSTRFYTHIQIVWDLLFVTSLLFVTGGLKSLFSFLYILVILSCSVFLTRREIFFVAAAAAILYGSLVDLQFYGFLPLLEGMIPLQVDTRDVFYAVFVHVVAFFLTGLLGSTLSEKLRRSELALEKREIDYEELENLNRTILANITSGLMIINDQGRIRSFNSAAAKLTGYSLEEVYNRDVREIFPHFQVFHGEEFAIITRGEGQFFDRKGRSLTLGYASSLVKDPQDKTLGLLVTFQDLTHLKEMEEQLKRADRLAAVGRLASGMAHEIRNPLASISGSVQLLMDDEQISPEDRRLMGIVVKEADRLSGLLTDFLVFARPAPPKPTPMDVSALLGEIADMAGGDPRFGQVQIAREYPPGVSVRADRDQLRQALWNLVINGAEAMEGKGILRLGVEGKGTIFVEDTGPGIPEKIRDKIFDPFFTTKDSGTGLGLATVYSIIEAHGGRITFSSGSRKGTRFTIFLPS